MHFAIFEFESTNEVLDTRYPQANTLRISSKREEI